MRDVALPSNGQKSFLVRNFASRAINRPSSLQRRTTRLERLSGTIARALSGDDGLAAFRRLCGKWNNPPVASEPRGDRNIARNVFPASLTPWARESQHHKYRLPGRPPRTWPKLNLLETRAPSQGAGIFGMRSARAGIFGLLASKSGGVRRARAFLECG